MKFNFKSTTLCLALAIAALFGNAAFAWDCSVPANRTLNVPGNECYVPPVAIPKPIHHIPIRPTVTNNTTSQGQGQSQTADGGTGGVGGAGGTGGVANANSEQHQGQHQNQTAESNNAGNSQSTTYSPSSTYNEVRQAVDGYSSGTNSTAACVRDQHAGVGTIIGGISFGHGKRDSDCAREQLAYVAWARGNDEAAVRIYCSIGEVRKALGSDCEELMARPKTIAPAAQAPVVNYVTQEELRSVEDRIVGKLVSK